MDTRLLMYWNEYSAYKRGVAMISKHDIEHSFTYHAPQGNQPARYGLLRDKAKELGLLIIEHIPTCREQSLAITKLEEAIMWANKAIACNE